MNKVCELCGGACCEGMIFDAHKIFSHPDVVRWFQLHGNKVRLGTYIKCKCSKLTADGKCAIYEQRPRTCMVFLPGNSACLESIKRERPEMEKQIVEALNGSSKD